MKIGQSVIIAPDKSRHRPSNVTPEMLAKIIDFKWNLVQVRYNDGHIDWVESTRVYNA